MNKEINVNAILSEEEIEKNTKEYLIDYVLDSQIRKILFRAEMICNYTLTIISILSIIWSFFQKDTNTTLFRLGVINASILFWIVSVSTTHYSRIHIIKLLDKRTSGRAVEDCIFKNKGE